MKRSLKQQGFALPLALLIMLVIAGAGAIFSNIVKSGTEFVKSGQGTANMFYVAEGALQDVVSSMAIEGNLWIEQPMLTSSPSGYVAYAPASYASSNGIPTCGGAGCHRHLHPVEGGLVKNVGPITGVGSQVYEDYPITDQIDYNDFPDADIELNGVSGFSQVERLDEAPIGATSIGGDLMNNPSNGAGVNPVRFRVTGYATQSHKGRRGRSVVVAVVEIPPA
ncbi:MAG: hypothetical protein KDD62_05915 [Bdellovibrionales bacterium]|nr:hypothetical protein [Bdellovibrionales bacterium]